MLTYIISIIFAAVVLLIAAVIANAIKFEGGNDPQDPKNRKIWFWILAVLNPALFYVIAAFVMAPNNRSALEEWKDSLPVATVIGFVAYIILGFVLSATIKNGKINNWFHFKK